jgi:hypothetical protein
MKEISQAISYFDCDWKVQPNERKTITYPGASPSGKYTREHKGIIYAVYLLTDNNLMELIIGQDDNEGINNCAYDLFTTQGHKTRDNGILFCDKYQVGHFKKEHWYSKKRWIEPMFHIAYENPCGMRYDENFTVAVTNISKEVATIKSVIILYATVVD